jgi:TatA/E family protein of Tat protein translocase
VVGDLLQPTHLLFVLVIALLVLGPKRLPEVARTLGNGLRDFRAAINGEHSDDDDPREAELTPYVAPDVDETHTNGTEATAEAEPAPATAESIPEPEPAAVTTASVPEVPEPNVTPEPVVKPPVATAEAAAPATPPEPRAPATPPEPRAPATPPEPRTPATPPEPTAEHPVPTGQAPEPERLP